MSNGEIRADINIIDQDDYGQDDDNTNADLSQDDIDYLQTLDHKLSERKLTVRAQPFMSAHYSNQLNTPEQLQIRTSTNPNYTAGDVLIFKND